MKKLIKSGKYNAGKRPSEYNVGEASFLNDNGGSIPSNVIIASNTTSKDRYIKYCKDHHFEIHPAIKVYPRKERAFRCNSDQWLSFILSKTQRYQLRT